jgi:16S rRNA (guanine527-N7)-methyltransferase
LFHVEQESGLAELLIKGASDLGITLSGHNVSAFLIYLQELLSWNRKINLTAITQEREVVVKHFLDSLACSKALDRSPSVSFLDVGSGAGFPGLPLKIVYPDLDLILLEPNLKKTAFLWHIIGTLHLQQAVVISRRVEDLARDQAYHEKFSYIVTRALEAGSLLPFALPLLKTNGRLILCRAKPVGRQARPPGLQLEQEIAYWLPFGYGDRVLSVFVPESAVSDSSVPRGTITA